MFNHVFLDLLSSHGLLYISLSTSCDICEINGIYFILWVLSTSLSESDGLNSRCFIVVYDFMRKDMLELKHYDNHG